jgi:putative transposase
MARTPWPHAPEHRLGEPGRYIVTVGTYRKEHHFRGDARLSFLHQTLLDVAPRHGWALEAWAVFSNHYHFVGFQRESAASLTVMLSSVHSDTATWINRLDDAPERRVWHNFWETRLTHERSYFARLNYVHQNPVHHGLVRVASQYRWGSAAWFERTATPARVRTVYSFRMDRLRVFDDFQF